VNPRKKSAYKAHADLNREIAGHLGDIESKEHLFAMADLYDNIARSIDATESMGRGQQEAVHFT
jgi:hypothetical protein